MKLKNAGVKCVLPKQAPIYSTTGVFFILKTGGGH